MKEAVFKGSGIAWVGEIPSHWAIAPLLSVASETKLKNHGMSENNLLSLSYGNIVRKDIEGLEGLLPESFETYQIVEADDIVLRLTDMQNDQRSLRSGICRERGIITSAYLALRPRGSDPNYLAYFFRACDLAKVLYSLGGGLRQSMKYSDLRRFLIICPPLPEQQAIAAFLDRETGKIDALVEEQRRLIALLKEKRQAVISHAVTKGLDPTAPMKPSGIDWLGDIPAHWDLRACGTVSNVTRGASPRPAGDPKYFSGEHIPWVTVAEITKDDAIELEDTASKLTLEGAAHSRVFPSGTVIYSNSGATLGVPKILRMDACANDGVVGFEQLSSCVHPVFLYHYLSSLTELIREEIRQGAGQPNLNTALVKKRMLALPPLSEQEEVIEFIEARVRSYRSLTAEATRAIDLLQERRAALISAAVTGKIDVRAQVDTPEVA